MPFYCMKNKALVCLIIDSGDFSIRSAFRYGFMCYCEAVSRDSKG